MQKSECRMQNAFRLLTNPYSKKRYVKVHKKVKQLCLHLQSGVQGRSPCKKDDVILRARPQTILRPKDLVPRPFTSAARCLYGVV